MPQLFRFTSFVPRRQADGLVKTVYDQISREFGLVAEPFSLHSPSPPILAGTWAMLRESLVVGNRARAEKETIAAAISHGNRCPWCHDAHVTMLHATGSYASQDPFLQEIDRWARASCRREEVVSQPFDPEDAPEFLATALAFHYLNRMVSALLVERVMPANQKIRGTLQRIGGLLFSRQTRKVLEPGASSVLLPDAPLPEDLLWAAPNPYISTALAQMASIVEEEADSVLSPEARQLIDTYLEDWTADPPALGGGWATPLMNLLPPEERPALCIALYCAVAPHQLSARQVESFLSQHSSERGLIAAASWGSFAAARRICCWLTVPTPYELVSI